MGGKIAVVIGGGNSGLEAVRDLTAYAKKTYLLHRRDKLRGDAVTAQKLENHPSVEFIYNAIIEEIMGDTMVSSVMYKDKESGEEKKILVEGVFVEIGARPNSELVEGLVDKNDKEEVLVDHKTQETTREGIWAAGDVSDVLYKQNNISSGDAIKAVMNIHEYLHSKK
jgi:thioredoxin reductase